MSVQNYRIPLGEEFYLAIERENDDGSGDMQNITGYTYILLLKEDLADADADAVASHTNTTHDTPASGLSHVGIAGSSTEDLTERTYYYAVKEITAGGRETIVVEGEVEFYKSAVLSLPA